jgi:hypothetical protein
MGSARGNPFPQGFAGSNPARCTTNEIPKSEIMWLTISGVIISLIGAVILAYPSINPEDERFGRVVRPGMGIQKALDKLSSEEKPFWTDKKICIFGLSVTVVGAILTLLDLVLMRL